ncbi:hypothetical protein [Candidatus Aalborgicola defluviihabitans]|uniref:hypothetical protein n=1 Tax=Candidatus Aalborgicola defluviihabitans TaxID=3386187 RepID=UPI0039B8D5D5
MLEVVSVPVNLCARVPDSVADEEAAFTVLGAIALQGIRLVQPTLGETVVVTGLGADWPGDGAVAACAWLPRVGPGL